MKEGDQCSAVVSGTLFALEPLFQTFSAYKMEHCYPVYDLQILQKLVQNRTNNINKLEGGKKIANTSQKFVNCQGGSGGMYLAISRLLLYFIQLFNFFFLQLNI